jgi:tetratricopeptide (TPR) repeat protein
MAARTPGGSCPLARFVWVAASCAPAPRARRLASASAFAAALSIVGPALADDAQQFELAKTRFDAGSYDEAAARFAAMLDPTLAPCERGPTDAQRDPCRLSEPDLIERARGLAAAALVALGRAGEADAYIEKVLLDNPTYAPNPAVFQPEVIDRFTAVRARIRAQIEAGAKRKAEDQREARQKAEEAREEERRYVAELSRLAESERVVETRSRWIAAVPFGAGQFQNGDRGLGWLFLAGEAAAGATSIISALALTSFQGVDVSPKDPASGERNVDIDALNARIDVVTAVNRVAFGAFMAMAVTGIVHAQLTFVPERATLRKRPIPPPPPSFSAAPTISVFPGGAALGVGGRF